LKSLAKPAREIFGLFADAWCGNAGAPNQFGVFKKERLNTTDSGVTGHVDNHLAWFEDHASRVFERPCHTHGLVGGEEWAGNFVR
jgi:hypothetical protein